MRIARFVLVGLVLGTAASAQTVPVPTPAPKRDAAQSNSQVPRPPGAIPSDPATATPPAAAAPAAATSSVRRGETSTAFDSTQRALAERVSAYLSSVQTMVGTFVQVGPDGGRTEGQLYLQKPGKVRFEYNPPSPIDVIADGQSVVVRDRKLATQDLYPLSQTPLRFLLADKIDLLRDTNLVSVTADDVFVTLVIDEKQVLVGTHRLMMMFGAKDFQLRQWTVTDPQGYDTTVAVFNIDTTKKPDPSLFKINYERVLQ
jgi:outer membrane lipoprotein-sorting protein